jgi:hypothetical protein
MHTNHETAQQEPEVSNSLLKILPIYVAFTAPTGTDMCPLSPEIMYISSSGKDAGAMPEMRSASAECNGALKIDRIGSSL